MKAFCNTGFASRPAIGRRKYPKFPGTLDFWVQPTSIRVTSKSRDFILAVMPQYSFYAVPADAKSMTFCQLFADCYMQLQNVASPLKFELAVPRLLSPHSDNFHTWAENIPEPVFLGDLMKLLNGPTNLKTPLRGLRVSVEDPEVEFSELHRRMRKFRSKFVVWNGFAGPVPSAKELISQGTAVSRMESHALFKKLFPNFCSWDERIFVLIATEVMCSELTPRVLQTPEGLRLLDRPDIRGDIFRLTCLVTCDLGSSAFEWSKQHLTPVFVVYKKRRIPSMVPIQMMENLQDFEFCLLEVSDHLVNHPGKKRPTLVAISGNKAAEHSSITRCLFPPELLCDRGVEYWKLRLKDWLREIRGR